MIRAGAGQGSRLILAFVGKPGARGAATSHSRLPQRWPGSPATTSTASEASWLVPALPLPLWAFLSPHRAPRVACTCIQGGGEHGTT